MRKIWWVVAVGVVTAVAWAAENQAYFGIFAETSVQKNAGQPDMSEMLQGMDPAMLQQLPPNVRAMMGGGPQRRLTMRLWSPGLAPKDATATVAPPAGLKQGQRLDLALYRPGVDKGEDEGVTGGTDTPPKVDRAKFTIKRYWGSSPTVKPGQPEITTWGGLTAEQQAEYEQQASKMQANQYFYKPDWTTGYWPTDKQPGQIAADASLQGTYALSTTYTGNVSITVPDTMNFLAPFDLLSPKMSEAPDLKQALAFRWKPIATALGLYARIFGMEGENTYIMWSSSEVRDDLEADLEYLEMAQVRAFVQKQQMMPGDRTAVTVPAGIFAECDMTMLTMVGYGPGVALPEGQPLPRVQTKTTLNGNLGGKLMANLGGGQPPAGDDGDE